MMRITHRYLALLVYCRGVDYWGFGLLLLLNELSSIMKCIDALSQGQLVMPLILSEIREKVIQDVQLLDSSQIHA